MGSHTFSIALQIEDNFNDFYSVFRALYSNGLWIRTQIYFGKMQNAQILSNNVIWTNSDLNKSRSKNFWILIVKGVHSFYFTFSQKRSSVTEGAHNYATVSITHSIFIFFCISFIKLTVEIQMNNWNRNPPAEQMHAGAHIHARQCAKWKCKQCFWMTSTHGCAYDVQPHMLHHCFSWYILRNLIRLSHK